MTLLWIGAGAVGLLAAVAGVAWWLRRSLVQVTIDGDSMAPNLVDGQTVLLRRNRSVRVNRGDVVAMAPEFIETAVPVSEGDRSGGRLWIVKRVAAAPGDPIPPGLGVLAERAGEPVPDGHLVLLGDNPDHSHDSRQDGLVDLDRLRGKIIGSN